MRLLELAALYLLLGLGCGAVVLLRPAEPAKRWLDATLMVAFWPLCAPFLLSSARTPAAGKASSEIAFLAALRRAAGTPLGALLPDEATARALGRRLRVAAGKLAEIEELLRRPEFDEAGASGIRLQNIRRLKRLRDRFGRELCELEELLAQLTTQAEVVRLAGAADSETRDLVREILSRVEGLDAVLDDEPRRLDTMAESR
ncbi:MAG TPA: hypothetical protein VM686_41910 [Polyangiaceae bacterium]|nr:hypothetical protein [Polyangiaceae bacterium]